MQSLDNKIPEISTATEATTLANNDNSTITKIKNANLNFKNSFDIIEIIFLILNLTVNITNFCNLKRMVKFFFINFFINFLDSYGIFPNFYFFVKNYFDFY